ncbi:hypothetical protein RJ640_002995 [Escallonia rubra]|uniref:Uncharacterized protein n=1 Tax=Escallonia rubra TaxID=112253 RepID=A0AA88RM35_9ASTE|nr:hypothetical protein RJ640_002995 [Escallonia rubra]
MQKDHFSALERARLFTADPSVLDQRTDQLPTSFPPTELENTSLSLKPQSGAPLVVPNSTPPFTIPSTTSATPPSNSHFDVSPSSQSSSALSHPMITRSKVGIQVNCTLDGLFLHQSKYAGDLLQRAMMVDSKPIANPMAPKSFSVKNRDSLFHDRTLFQSIVGGLQYLIMTQPDLSYAIGPVVSLPGDQPLIFARFLVQTISWSAKKQSTVARSSAETEYRAMASTTAELTWLSFILRDIGIVQHHPATLFCDNLAALYMSINPVFRARTKHIEVDYHFIREKLDVNNFTMISILPELHWAPQDIVVEEPIQSVTKSITLVYRGYIISAIDLSCNNFAGHIPPEIGKLFHLKSLNLSYNSLSGTIPITFANLTGTESLDLSYNRLTGNIPSLLAKLDSLEVFNVSFNNLSGPIPEGPHFQTFDNMSYIGNQLLCGKPVTRNCTDPKLVPVTPRTRKETEFMDMDTFYVSFAAAYITMLLGVLAVLCINPYWRQAWFHLVEVSLSFCYYFVVDNLL